MISLRHISRLTVVAAATALVSEGQASELSYTFVDFQAVSSTVTAVGQQTPVPGQTVNIVTQDGDGISIGGSVSIGERFFFGGAFQTSIVDVAAVITNPFGTTTANDNFDLIQSRFGFGYQRELKPNLDLVFELTLDSNEYDFGSFAGENFDMQDDGVGARIGFRWNPRQAFELYGDVHHSPVGEASLSALEFESDTTARLGVMWYFFEDLGIGIDYATGQVDTTSISMRFSFGDLRVQR